MLRNYLKIAFRNLLKNKAFSIINIAGLALGLTCCLLISLYVVDELSYDKFHENAENIYRVNSDIKFGGQEMTIALSNDPIGATLVNDYPQVKQSVRFHSRGDFLVTKGDQTFREERIIFADSTLFDVFTFPLLIGNPETALARPKTMVVTESTARKYFDRTDVIGEVLRFDNEDDYEITGVMQDIPTNSHIRYDFFLSLAGDRQSQQNMWLSHNFYTYVVLEAGADPGFLPEQMDQLMEQYVGPQAQRMIDITMEEFEASGNYIRYSLMPLTDIHLHSNRAYEMGPNSNIQYVYLFAAIAFFVLLIACINFMNLSTARSAGRAREVGIRKVLGSVKSRLIGQFLTESILMTLIAFALAIVATWLLLPWFNQLAGKEIALNNFANWAILPVLLVFVLVTGLLAGSYPAFFLSSFRPVNVLKGRLGINSSGSNLFRSGLVVVQFVASVLLIIGTIVIYRQLNYIQTKELGFKKEQVLIIEDAFALENNLQAFKEEALRESGVKTATVSSFLPVPSSRSDSPLFATPVPDQENAVQSQHWWIDHDYFETMGMEVIDGRAFSRDFPSDSSAVILNEAAVNMFGFDDPVGEAIYRLQGDFSDPEVRRMNVVGVVRDFHFESLRNNITPVAFFLGNSSGNISLRLSTDDISNTISRLETTWKEMAIGQPFNYTFMDEAFDEMYRAEQRIGNIFVSFAILAIFIACLGLFGLSAFMAEQRMKEIGIRKVLGASINNIVTMLSKDFLKLVIIAALIAFPLAWWGMSTWLEEFAYRTELSWWIFAVAAVIAIIVAIATVSFQALRAATTNPVQSIRSE